MSTPVVLPIFKSIALTVEVAFVVFVRGKSV